MVIEDTRAPRLALVVDELHGRILVDGSGTGTVVWSGDGEHDYLCGACAVPIVVGATPTVSRTHAFRCRRCRSFNVVAG